MSRQPLVSILTPTYNHAELIGPCIESVLAQTDDRWEQIIVDDGSTDATWSEVQRYAARDERIQAVRQSHKGAARLAETYNAALARANGTYIAVLEGDDWWLPNKLASQLPAFTSNTILSYGAYFDEINGHLQPGRRPSFVGHIPCDDFLSSVLLHRSFMIAVTQMIRKDALLAIGGFHQDGSPAAVDLATLLRLVQSGGNVCYVAEPLGVWRHHAAQSTNRRAIELAMFNARLALHTYDTLTPARKADLGLQRQAIVQARRAQIAEAYFGVLRSHLRTRQRRGVYALIAGTWRYGDFKRKLEAVYALGGTLLGYDFEPILRLAARLGSTGV